MEAPTNLNPDPILQDVYAAKAAFAAKHGNDLHKIAEAMRRSPAWTPIQRPARPIRTAQARLRRLTDPGDIIREVRAIRAQLLEQAGGDLHNLAERANRKAPEILAGFREDKQKTPSKPSPFRPAKTKPHFRSVKSRAKHRRDTP